MKYDKQNICYSEHSIACHNNNWYKLCFTLPLFHAAMSVDFILDALNKRFFH